LKPLHSQTVTARCGVLTFGVIGPIFLKMNLALWLQCLLTDMYIW